MAATSRTPRCVPAGDGVTGVLVTPSPAAAANGGACALFCDTRDPSPARQETAPAGTVQLNGRRRVPHVALNSPPVPAGILFIRYLMDAGSQYQRFTNTQAATLWNGSDPLNRISSRWSQPSAATPDRRTRASALSALPAAAQ